MYVPRAKTADRGILLSLLVKAYTKTEPLPEERGARPARAGGERKKPPEHTESGPGYGNAYDSVLYCYGNTPEYLLSVG